MWMKNYGTYLLRIHSNLLKYFKEKEIIKMELEFAPRGILQINNARIIYRNFSGEGSKYNREGDRNFAMVIPDEELAETLVKDGWNVKTKPPKDEDDSPFIFLPIKVKFNDRGPNVYLVSGHNRVKLDEESISILDDIDISNVDLDIRPYDWIIQEGTSNEKRGRAAYLQGMKVIQELDRFAEDCIREETDRE